MNTAHIAPASSNPRPLPIWALLGVVLIIVGCKLWLVASFSSPLPFLDQWKGEGKELVQPWLHGQFQPSDTFKPFNEHRILPSRLLVLGLFQANAGQWDAQVQMIAGVALHAACAFVLGAVLWPWFGSRRAPALGFALLVIFALPFGWQNTLWGFQSQFYFLILLTLLTFWGLGLHAPLTARWWLGVVSGVAACTSMGSGGFAGLALLAALGTKAILQPGHHRFSRVWITALAAVLLAGLGFALFTPAETESLTSFRKPSFGEFLNGFALRLSWPNVSSPFFALLAYAPFVALLGWHLRHRSTVASRRTDDPAPEDFLFPLGFWVILQAAALAYSRNHVMASVISRYMDLLAPGALVNFCCLWRLLDLVSAGKPTLRFRRIASAILIAWTAITLLGLVPISQRNVRTDLPALLRMHKAQALALRTFLVTDATKDLGGKALFGVPESEMESLANLLRDPAMRDALPVGLGIRRTETPPGPLTVAAQILTDAWQIVLGSGVLILGIGVARQHSQRREILLDAVPTAL